MWNEHCVGRGVLGATAAALVMFAGSANAQVSDTRVPLNYNFHGMATSAEAVSAATPGNADIIQYRSISDRGLYFEAFDVDSIAGTPLLGWTGIGYGFYDSLGHINSTHPDASTYGLNVVHMGSRGSWNRNWDAVGTTDVGPQPAWGDAIIDHTGDQVTTLSSPITVDGGTEFGVLYTVSDGGGQFDCVLTFSNGTSDINVTARLNAPDWFGTQSDPAVISPFVVSQKRMTHTNGTGTYSSFRAVSNNDSALLQAFNTAANGNNNLNVVEAVISVPRMTAAGINVAGRQLTKVTFKNAMYAPLSFTTMSGNGTNATVTTTSQTYVAGQPIIVAGLNPNTWNYEGPLGTVVSATQFTYPNATSGTNPPAQMQFNGNALTTLTGNGTVSTATAASAHGLSVGDTVVIMGASQAGHNGRWQVASVPSATQFTFLCGVNATSSAQRQVYRQGVGRGYMIYAFTARSGQPANSTPATAQQVFVGNTTGDNFHTFGGTPTTCGVNDTTAVWYQYFAPGTNSVEVRTCGSSLDTTLAVYRQSDMSLIDCNDNGCGSASRIIFPATSGTTYLIRVAGKGGATGTFTLGVADPAPVDIAMPLQFNWNGICNGPTEQTVTTPVAHENRSDLNGYRSIADRGLLCDGIQTNALNYGGTLGYEGMIYNVYSTPLQSDMIHLGDRSLAAGGGRNWSPAGTTWPTSGSLNGLRPAWLNQDSQPASTSSMSSLNAVFGPSTRIGVLYHMANGGTSYGSIDMTLGFTDSTQVTVTLDATDWFESNATAMPAARNGVLIQRKTGPWRAVQNTDKADDGGAAANRLWVDEAVVTTGSLAGTGIDVNGKTLSTITFSNVRSAPNGAGNAVESAFGIFAATLRDPASYNIVQGPGGIGTLTPNQITVGATGKMTVAVSRGTGSPNNITSVVVDGSSIGLGNITLNDSGTNGDTTPNDNVFSRSLAFPVNTTPGTVILPFTVTDAQSRTSAGSIIFTVTLPTGTITPDPVRAGDPALVTSVLPNNGNIGSVSLDLSQIGGTSVGLNDSGLNGDVAAADGTWSAAFTVPASATRGTFSLPLTVVDVNSNSATGSASAHIVAPPASTDMGSLANGRVTFTDTLNAGDVKWLKITLPMAIDSTNFFDIDTEGTLISGTNDTELGLYDSNGVKIAEDDDDGSGNLSQLSFGAANPARPAVGNGAAYNGRDGATLAAGTYYLAYVGFNATFNGTEWNVTTTSANTGTIQVNLSTGGLPAGGLPTSFIDLGTIGTNPVTGNGTIAVAGGVQWFKFEVPSNIASVDRTYLDIDTQDSGIADTVIGLFRDDGTGALVAQDNDDGSGAYSQLTFGRGGRPAVGDGLAYNGRDGATLAAGTYYLAVTESQAAFGNNYIVFFNTGTNTGPVQVHIGRGTMPPTPLNLIAGPIFNPATGNNYFLYDVGATPTLWTDAEAFAQTMGGHLVSIADADENEFVRSQVLGFGGTDRRGWIGLNDFASQGNYVWSDGTSVGYTNWNAGEPNHSGGIEFYAEMLSSNGAWNDQDNDGVAGVGEFTVIEAPGTLPCGTSDFNGDGDFGTDSDIEAFFACLAGNCCPECYPGGSDFNADGDFGTDADIESFFRVLAGGQC